MMRLAVVVIGPLLLAGCVTLRIGGDAAPQSLYMLEDSTGASPPRRAEPLVRALLIHSLPANALADTTSIAYSRRAGEFAFYQLASWAERPTRELPRLLQRRLEARGTAAAVALFGEPLHADWTLALRIDTLVHDATVPPGTARLALTAELFDRRSRTRVARRQFEANAPTATADSGAAAVALSLCVTRVFDALLPWLEDELQGAPARLGANDIRPD